MVYCKIALVAIMLVYVSMGEEMIVDLSHNLSAKSAYYPGYPEFTITRHIYSNNDLWSEWNMLNGSDHSGTHMDAPSHSWKGAQRQHEVPVKKLIGPGVVIDVKEHVERNHDFELDVEHLEQWEEEHGRIPDNAIVLMNSGWDSRYDNKSLVFNTHNLSDSGSYHFPGFGLEAVKWLHTKRNIDMFGTDTPSTEIGQTKMFPVHRYTGKNNIPGLENVAGLDQLPLRGATIFVGSVKFFQGSGSPSRVLGVFDSSLMNTSSSTVAMSAVNLMSILLAWLLMT